MTFLYQHLLLRQLLNCFNVCLHLLEIPVHKFTSPHTTFLCVCVCVGGGGGGGEGRKGKGRKGREEGEGEGEGEGDAYIWEELHCFHTNIKRVCVMDR